MTLPIYVSILRREKGVEVIRDFGMIVSNCEGCLRRRRHTLTPVETGHGDAKPVPVGAPLCKACCLSLPLLAQVTRATWPAAFTAREAESLWDLVRKEQIAQALELGRTDASATALEGIQGTMAASQQTARHQGIDRTGKVA